jgi:hypothetical protein
VTAVERISTKQPEPFEVNIVYTKPQPTFAALRFAESLVSGLNPSIHLRAVLSVPRQLPIDQSPVSVLLGRSFGASISIELLDDPPVHLEPATGSDHQAFERALRSIRSRILVLQSSIRSPKFSIETNVTAASFLTVSSISLQVRHAEAVLKHSSTSR